MLTYIDPREVSRGLRRFATTLLNSPAPSQPIDIVRRANELSRAGYRLNAICMNNAIVQTEQVLDEEKSASKS